MYSKNETRSVVSNFCTVKSISKNKLIAWYRDNISPQIRTINELGTGIDFCIGMEILFPGCIGLHKIKLNNPGMSDRRQHFKNFQSALDSLGIIKEIPIEKLESESFSENYYFARWFKSFFEANYSGEAYDLDFLRPWCKAETKAIGCGDCLSKTNVKLKSITWNKINKTVKRDFPMRLQIKSNIMSSLDKIDTVDGLTQTDKTYYDTIEEHLAFVKNIIDELSEVNNKLTQTNKSLEQSKMDLELEKEDLLRRNKTLASNFEDFSDKINDLNEKIKLLTDENYRISKSYEDLFQLNERLNTQKSELEDNVNNLRQCNEGLSIGLTELKRCHETLEVSNTHVIQSSAILERNNQKMQKKEYEFENTIKTLINRNLALERNMKETREKYEATDLQNTELKRQLEKLEFCKCRLTSKLDAANNTLTIQSGKIITKNECSVENCENLSKCNDSLELGSYTCEHEDAQEDIDYEKQLNHLRSENDELKHEIKVREEMKSQLTNLKRINDELTKDNKNLKERNDITEKNCKQLCDCNQELTQEINECKELNVNSKRRLTILYEITKNSQLENKNLKKHIEILKSYILDAGNRCLNLAEKIKHITEDNESLKEKMMYATQQIQEQGEQNLTLLKTKSCLESKICELLQYNLVLEEDKQDLMKYKAGIQIGKPYYTEDKTSFSSEHLIKAVTDCDLFTLRIIR
ncbi:microtubule-associated protein RP/EB family member 1-like [Argonauta hians]